MHINTANYNSNYEIYSRYNGSKSYQSDIEDNYVESDSATFSTSKRKEEDKYDGKIGLFGIIKNVGKGALKSVGEGIKSCFLNENGKFSIGRTLLSLGTAATCIAIPALGFSACALGAVIGGGQLISGTYNALTADSDREAEEAWQNVGSGGLMLTVSVFGGKASLNAMKTSAIRSGAGSAINKLDKNSSIIDVAKAFKADSANSTKYNLSQLKRNGFSHIDISSLDDTISKENIQAATEIVTENVGVDDIATITNAVKQSSNKAAIKKAIGKISEPAQKIYEQLIEKNIPIGKIIEQFGLDNVIQVLNTIKDIVPIGL